MSGFDTDDEKSISTESNYTRPAEGTWMGWAYFNAWRPSTGNTLFGNDTWYYLRVNQTGNVYRARIFGLDVRIEPPDPNMPSLNTLHHCAFAYTVGNLGAHTDIDGWLYIDGVEVATGTLASGTAPSAERVWELGNTSSSAANFGMQGELFDCRLYDRRLSAAEIANVYAARGTDGNKLNLDARWLFNEDNAGSNVPSAAGSVKDRSINNFGASEDSGVPTYVAGRGVRRRRRRAA